MRTRKGNRGRAGEILRVRSTKPRMNADCFGLAYPNLVPVLCQLWPWQCYTDPPQPKGISTDSPVPIMSAAGFWLVAMTLVKKPCHSESACNFDCNSP